MFHTTDMDAKEEVRSRLAIEDVISEYVQLRRAGRNWKGLSPFGAEKTPSFIVSPDKQIWHDFSSGRGGDIFSFIQEMEGVDFKGALEILARRAGVDLDQFKTVKGTSSQSKERLYEANELACKFFQANFAKSSLALEYVLKKREFSKATALEWRLGYAPNNGTALIDFLRKKGFKDTEIKLAGLTSTGRRGLQDIFRGRLMIPLADAQGRVIGFTARLLVDDPNAPKYINTPSTPLYDKSRHVFGLHLAKDAIRKTSFVVLAEGNLDVIASHQAGVKQVVATAGTALTEHHIKTLNRFTGDIRLCFDADKAGLNATERAIPIASKVGVNLQIISIPAGKDPDELIRQDVSAWQKAIEAPLYAVDWLIRQYQKQVDMSTALGKRTLSDVVLKTIRQLNDPVEQDHYLTTLAGILQVNKQALEAKVSGIADETTVRRRPRADTAKKTAKVVNSEAARTEEHLMALALMQPTLRTNLYNLSPEMFSSDSARAMFDFLAEYPDFDGKDANLVQKMGDYGRILSLVYETLYQDIESMDLHAEAVRLRNKIIRTYVQRQKQSIVQQMHDASTETTEQLLKQAKELDEFLRITQEEDASGAQE